MHIVLTFAYVTSPCSLWEVDSNTCISVECPHFEEIDSSTPVKARASEVC